MRLKDVGHAELGAESYANDLQFNGQDAVGIGVTQLSTANALDVDRRAIAELDRLSKSFPPGMHYKLAFDTTDAVGESIRDVVFTVGSAILLVILVIFIFLGDWRTTMIHFIATPVSLIGTFVFVKLLGFSVNTLTLFGITLATGLVVDDAIVVIENIERHIQEGEHDSHKAAAAGHGRRLPAQSSPPRWCWSRCLCRWRFFPGTTGILFRQFALTIAFSIAISAFQCADPGSGAGGDFSEPGATAERWWWLQKFDDGRRCHDPWVPPSLLHHVLKYKLAMAVLFFAGLGLTYFVFTRVPTGFVPDEDQGYFIIVIQAPSGASLEYTKAIGQAGHRTCWLESRRLEAHFRWPASVSAGAAANQGLIFVPLKPYSQRKGDEHAATAILNRVRPHAVWGIGGDRVSDAAAANSGSGTVWRIPVRGAGSGGAQTRRTGGHRARLPAAISVSTRNSSGCITPFTANDPQYLVTIDREKAKSLHVPLSQITDTLGVYMGSAYVNDFDFNNRSYRVYVQADKQFRAEAENMKRFYVRSDSGAMVPLDNLITITQTTTPQVISHYNLFRSAEIDGSPAPGYSSGQAIAAMEQTGHENAAGILLQLDGIVAGRVAGGRHVAASVWTGHAGRVPDAVGAV